MALDLMREKGVPLEEQLMSFTWRDMVRVPVSKLDDDAFTKVRIILMNGIESEQLRFKHVCGRLNEDLRLALAQVRRVEQFQQTTVNWLLPADMSPLEITLGYEQVAIEVTASIAQSEPDPYLAQVYRFGLLEDFDHLYRYSALYERTEGKDPNNILQSYTDILPGRPTAEEHRAPQDDLRDYYKRSAAAPITKMNAYTLVAGEYQTHDFYMTVGPMFSDPLARQLYAEIAAIEEQHVTQYESIIDPKESWLEKWLLHEANEVYNYMSCLQYETNATVKFIWERFLDYELGQLHFVMDLFKRIENRDPAEVLPNELPEPIRYESHRQFVKDVLNKEAHLRAQGTQFVDREDPDSASVRHRQQLNKFGAPSEIVAQGYRWVPGTELVEKKSAA
ncbi:MAG TPA: hypothetical protein VF353_12770 [Candidatus Binatia bacterium]